MLARSHVRCGFDQSVKSTKQFASFYFIIDSFSLYIFATVRPQTRAERCKCFVICEKIYYTYIDFWCRVSISVHDCDKRTFLCRWKKEKKRNRNKRKSLRIWAVFNFVIFNFDFLMIPCILAAYSICARCSSKLFEIDSTFSTSNNLKAN